MLALRAVRDSAPPAAVCDPLTGHARRCRFVSVGTRGVHPSSSPRLRRIEPGAEEVRSKTAQRFTPANTDTYLALSRAGLR